MMPLTELVPDVETLLALDAPEVAGLTLQQLSGVRPQDPMRNVSQYCNPGPHSHFSNYPREHWHSIIERLSEGWHWLLANGFTVPDVHQTDGWVVVTRLGRKIASAERLREYRKGSLLQKDRLHQAIAERCHAQFIRGEFDTAVFEAYRTLEIEIRSAAQLPARLVGVPLARKAFAPTDGFLTDSEAEPGEQQALCDLMAGALGSYKNPHSHRRVEVTADEAAEMIALASHLLRIVDTRWQKKVSG